jgi:hypothetical protein
MRAKKRVKIEAGNVTVGERRTARDIAGAIVGIPVDSPFPVLIRWVKKRVSEKSKRLERLMKRFESHPHFTKVQFIKA